MLRTHLRGCKHKLSLLSRPFDDKHRLITTKNTIETMINANDFRIGNWVKNNKTQETEVLKAELFPELDKLLLDEVFSPMSLTENLLESAGFEKCEDGWFCKQYSWDDEVNIMCVNVLTFRFALMNKDSDDEGCYRDSVKFVHQVQNLFYLHAGHELDMNELK